MGRLFKVELEGDVYSCMYCNTQLSLRDDIFSRSSPINHGKAYLFDKVVNITEGEKELRSLNTGKYIVADIFCVQCGSILGWKYDNALKDNEKYKEGKFVVDRSKVVLDDDATATDSDDESPGDSDDESPVDSDDESPGDSDDA